MEINKALDHEALYKTISKQADRNFEEIKRLDSLLSRYGFLVNAGGAATTLAFIGTSEGRADIAVIPLVFFIVGLIATGFEIRTLLKLTGDRYGYISSRRELLRTKKIEDIQIEKILFPPDFGKGLRNANHWSGVISQGAFILGAVLGVILLIAKIFGTS